MRNKVIAALVAGGLLVGAGFVTSIVSAPGTASAQEELATEGEERGFFTRGFDFLGGVLDQMVSDGELDQATADNVLSNVESAAEEAKAEREAIHEAIKTALEDDILTEAEAADAGLPDDHWLYSDALDDAWADGELTTEEIREARPHPKRGAFRRGAHFGALLDDGGIDQAEYDELGDDHPLKQIDVSEYLSDGVITIDELREIREANRPSDSDINA